MICADISFTKQTICVSSSVLPINHFGEKHKIGCKLFWLIRHIVDPN